MASEACSDAGPILHLHELKQLPLLKLFSRVYISSIVEEELHRHSLTTLPRNVHLSEINKNQVAMLSERYSIDLGEASVIFLCKAKGIQLLLTDDLDAREVSQGLGLTPVGSVGIILRSYREGISTQKDAIMLLNSLMDKSSLFVTPQLVDFAISELKKYRKK